MVKKLIWKGTLGEAKKHPLYEMGKEDAKKEFTKLVGEFDEKVFVVKQDEDNPMDCGEFAFEEEDFKELKQKLEEI